MFIVAVPLMIRSSSVGAARPLPDLTHMPPRWGLRRFCLGAGTFHKPASRQAGLWSQCAPEGLETINMSLLRSWPRSPRRPLSPSLASKSCDASSAP